MHGLGTIRFMNLYATLDVGIAQRDRRLAALAYAAMLEDGKRLEPIDYSIIGEYINNASNGQAAYGKALIAREPMNAEDRENIARLLRVLFE